MAKKEPNHGARVGGSRRRRRVAVSFLRKAALRETGSSLPR